MVNISKLINVLYHINKRRDRNYMITSVGVEKALDKIQPLTRMVTEGTYLNVIKDIYDKPTFSIIERKEK